MGSVNDVLWSYVLIVMLVGLGIWFTLATGFVQLRRLGEMFRLITEGATAKPKHGHISTFQAFCVSTASRVGVGNIAGIAIAVVTGGPGAVFWMWVIATLGAATGFVESTLAQIYKAPKKKGGFVGGPAYYIGNVLGSPFFATLFAILISITYGLIFNSVQANTIALSVQTSYGFSPEATGLLVAAATALVIFGGITRIAKVVGVMVPFMAGAYLLIAAVITVMNVEKIPTVLATIVRSAFDFEALGGAGFALALMTGIKRGLFSNEAGMGSVPNAAATADATHPVKQGLIQTLGVFTDTLLICTCTAFIILFGGVPDASLNGIQLTQAALVSEVGPLGGVFVAVAIFLFAFSSIIGNYYYGEANIRFITRRRGVLTAYRLLVGGMVLFGSLAALDLAWSLADVTMALMTLCNLVAIVLLGRQALWLLADYRAQRRQGIRSPVYTRDRIPALRDKAECW